MEIKAISVVAVTAFAMKSDEERIREAGCEAYLSKPVAVAQFIKTQGSDRLYGPAIRADIAYRTNLYLNRAPSASMSPVVGCGKWIGKTYWPVPAISVRNLRRDRAACAGSQSKIVDQSGSRHCKAWCMRSPITTACCPRERILTQQ